MTHDHVFISHSTKDDGFVKELRVALEGLGIAVWADSRELRGGSKLVPKINEVIEQARQFIAVLSQNAVNSPWVRKEIQKALEVEQRRNNEGYRVIPLLLPGIEPSALALWFDEEPIGVRIEINAGGLSEALPDLLTALGARLPDDRQPIVEVAPQPVTELILKLIDLKVDTSDDKWRAKANAQLVYEPPDKKEGAVESRRFLFTAPLGAIEADELRWYLEDYFVWPVGIFKERAERIELQLPRWGEALYHAALSAPAAQEVWSVWQQAEEGVERHFSVFVERDLPEGASEEEQGTAGEAAAHLLSLPWELLHDGRGFLFHGRNPVRVRRRLPNRHHRRVRPTQLPIRILLINPRPEDEQTGYIDHRVSALPLLDAVESLGELATLTVLTPPTFPALEEALSEAAEAGRPYDVVHFNGHGVYDRRVGLGGLCFEDPNEVHKLEGRARQLIYAERLAEVIRDHGTPLVFLEACQSAKTEEDPTASVAAKLLEEGVTSVVAMTHSVLVETARRFVRAFYRELAEGKRVGSAMIAGQRDLYGDANRGRVIGAGELHLHDWFVPVLYQEEQDPQLITKLQPEAVRQLEVKKRRISFGELPAQPVHSFIGRSRELLVLERLLNRGQYAVIRGVGGEGKTALTVELTRWLVRTKRFQRAAFVSLEQYTDARGVLDSLGRQLLPDGDNWSVAQYPDLTQALQPIERALRDRPTIIMLDNLEGVMADDAGRGPLGTALVEELFGLCRKLLEAHATTRIVFTSREPLSAPFDDHRREIKLGAFSRDDAIKLVGEVMKQEALSPKSDDAGSDPQEVIELVEAVNRHARALVLLAREVVREGVRATTGNLHRLMARLHEKYPHDRENSLYASVELSLRRLPPTLRRQIRVLSVFQGGTQLGVLSQVLGVNVNVVQSIARQLVEVGLAEQLPYGYMRLDPALPSYLLGELSAEEQEGMKARWAEKIKELTYFLYEQRHENIEIAAAVTRLELPNLLGMLQWILERDAPEKVVEPAQRVESLLLRLGHQQALAQATRIREQAAEKLTAWSRARFLSECQSIDRLLEQGEIQVAYAASRKLLDQCMSTGEKAYPYANYDLAYAHSQHGRVLRQRGEPEAALKLLNDAQSRYQLLVGNIEGNSIAEKMVLRVTTDIGDCLRDLGRLDQAAAAYEESITRYVELGDKRALAAAKGQLGTVRLRQLRYKEAMESHDEARGIFESIGEPGLVAVAWEMLGLTHTETGQFEQAESAYRQSLVIRVQQRDLVGEASILSLLGELYDRMGRLEDAIKCYRQATDIYVRLKDRRREGYVCSSMGHTLIKLGQYDEARQQLMRGVKCNETYGHATQLWKTWNILNELELAVGNVEAAAQAQQRAIKSYLSYRRAGGNSMTLGAHLCTLIVLAIRQGDVTGVGRQLTELSSSNFPSRFKVMLTKLEAILRGERNPALADDQELSYHDATELIMLLEALAAN